MSLHQNENFQAHQLEIQAENLAKEMNIPIQIIHYCWINNCGDETTIKDDDGKFMCDEHANEFSALDKEIDEAEDTDAHLQEVE